jgi:hypothetical protein
MGLFDNWCDCKEKQNKLARLWKLTEREEAREGIKTQLAETMRSHYVHPERITEDVERLGYEAAARILGALLPQRDTARSGDIGEILATELVEERTGFNVPVRRLRYKDARDMALRGDDFIGVILDDAGELRLLKGESKSRSELDKATITEARDALNSYDGRCTPSSLLFVANQLLDDSDVGRQRLGRVIRDEIGLKALRPRQIAHMLFTLSGNRAPKSLEEDWNLANTNRAQYVVNLRIEDHREFIRAMYDEVQQLGDE